MVAAHPAGEPDLSGRLGREDDRRRASPREPTIDARRREHDTIGAVVRVVAAEDDVERDAGARDDRLRSVAVVDHHLDGLVASWSRARMRRLGMHQRSVPIWPRTRRAGRTAPIRSWRSRPLFVSRTLRGAPIGASMRPGTNHNSSKPMEGAPGQEAWRATSGTGTSKSVTSDAAERSASSSGHPRSTRMVASGSEPRVSPT